MLYFPAVFFAQAEFAARPTSFLHSYSFFFAAMTIGAFLGAAMTLQPGQFAAMTFWLAPMLSFVQSYSFFVGRAAMTMSSGSRGLTHDDLQSSEWTWDDRFGAYYNGQVWVLPEEAVPTEENQPGSAEAGAAAEETHAGAAAEETLAGAANETLAGAANETHAGAAVDDALNMVWSLLQQIDPNDPDAFNVTSEPQSALPALNDNEPLNRRVKTLRCWRRELVEVYQLLLSIRDQGIRND